MDALAVWLEGKYPKIKQALDANLEQRAFDNYEVQWEEERENINELHVLQTDFDFVQANFAVQKTLKQLKDADIKGGGPSTHNDDEWDEPAAKKKKVGAAEQQTKQIEGLDNDYQVTAVSWNCNGTNLAVAYGKTNHTTWCEHQSVVSIWPVFRRDFDP